MKKIIISIFTDIPISRRSHVRGWAEEWARRLDADIVTSKNFTLENLKNYDYIYIDSGVNFSGVYNIFGGMSKDLLNRFFILIELYKLNKKLICLDGDYRNIISDTIVNRCKKWNMIKDVEYKIISNYMPLITNKMAILTMRDLELNSAIIGDSHSVAYSFPDQMILKTNGLTLHHVIEKGIVNFIYSQLGSDSEVMDVTLCLGSIDIRHHLLRLMSMDKAVLFFKKFFKEVIAINSAPEIYGLKITVALPVPIEHEERRIPNTGKYKGEAFCASREERHELTIRVIKMAYDMRSENLPIYSPPLDWYQMDGKEYADKHMELNSSVHIAPTSYNANIDWSGIIEVNKVLGSKNV